MKVNIGKYTDDDSDRKINIRIDQYDTWNADHTLALIIHPVLVQLREQKAGIPGEMFRNDDGTECTYEVAEQKWNHILSEMIYAFQQFKDNHPDDTSFLNSRYKHDTAYHDRIDNGLMLFAKYYRTLWT